MSYDINFWFPQEGQTFDDWAESFDGTYPPHDRQRLGAAVPDVRTQVHAILPGAEVDDEPGGFALDDDASTISFGYSSQGVALSCPYRTGAGSSRVPLLYDIAHTVASLTGLRAWDPQTDAPVRGVHLDVAIGSYEKTARFAESLLRRPR